MHEFIALINKQKVSSPPHCPAPLCLRLSPCYVYCLCSGKNLTAVTKYSKQFDIWHLGKPMYWDTTITIILAQRKVMQYSDDQA